MKRKPIDNLMDNQPNQNNNNTEDQKPSQKGFTATRNNLQLGRRGIHLASGTALATLYFLFLTHKQVVYILGLTASILYLLEQIRLNYPHLSKHIYFINRFFLRAEEQLKESAALPYVMGVLLAILSFPKTIALIALYTLAIADPFAAIVGIKLGRHKIIGSKTIEGTIAFFLGASFCSYVVLFFNLPNITPLTNISISLSIGFFAAIFELLPIKIDDNYTIPIFVGIISWIILSVFQLNHLG